MKLDEVLKYITDIKLVFGGYIFAMNKSFYDGLSSDMQTKINDAAKLQQRGIKRNLWRNRCLVGKSSEKPG